MAGTDAAKVEAALARALNAVENPPMNGSNPHFKSKYATLPDVQRCVRAACSAHGIAYLQTLERDGDELLIVGYVCGDEGRLRLGGMPVSLPPNPQQAGSALTYAKRQLACLHWGIAGEEDDDGNGAAAQPKAKPKAQPKPKPQGKLKEAELRLKRAAEEYADASGAPREDVFGSIVADKELAGYEALADDGKVAWLDGKAAELSALAAGYGEEDVVF